MTNTYVIIWTDGTSSIIPADGAIDLAWKIDTEGDPTDPEIKIYKVKPDCNHFHLSISVDAVTSKQTVHAMQGYFIEYKIDTTKKVKLVRVSKKEYSYVGYDMEELNADCF